TDLDKVALFFRDGLDTADDLGANEIIGDRRDRHFDALLDRDGARALLDRARIAAHKEDGLQARVHGRRSPSLTDRRASEHFDDAGPAPGPRVLGQRIRRNEALP